jgi:hypothetical protein
MNRRPVTLLRRSGARCAGFALALLVAAPATVGAQTSTDAPPPSQGWNVGVYPVLAWVPTGIEIDLDLPPAEGGDVGSIVESRFDGAYLGGFYASKGLFRTDVDMVWAAVGGDRDRPQFSVDLDLVYFHATGGIRLAPGLYATAGVRRLALKYDIAVTGFPSFERKPGIWDPVVGAAFHYEGEGKPIEIHVTLEAGGFGVGSDKEYAAGARLDWKPFRHFGLAAGYSFLHLDVTDTVRDRQINVRQSLHGPVLGIGIYF